MVDDYIAKREKAEAEWQEPWDKIVSHLISPDASLKHAFYLGFVHGYMAQIPQKIPQNDVL